MPLKLDHLTFGWQEKTSIFFQESFQDFFWKKELEKLKLDLVFCSCLVFFFWNLKVKKTLGALYVPFFCAERVWFATCFFQRIYPISMKVRGCWTTWAPKPAKTTVVQQANLGLFCVVSGKSLEIFRSLTLYVYTVCICIYIYILYVVSYYINVYICIYLYCPHMFPSMWTELLL